MNNPKISIIVPVYKAEKYLHTCLDSIQQQTFTDWECILVDDGSPDNSGKICDDYAERDSRFRVIHKVNGGVSSARNAGINIADGDYCTFLDPDDYISCNHLEALIKHNLPGDRPFFVNGNFLFVDERTGKETQYVETDDFSFEANNTCGNNLERGSLLWTGASWGSLYSLSYIKKIGLWFPLHLKCCEDRVFVTKYLTSCIRDKGIIFCVKVPTYYHLITINESLQQRIKPTHENCDILQALSPSLTELFAATGEISRNYRYSICTTVISSNLRNAIKMCGTKDEAMAIRLTCKKLNFEILQNPKLQFLIKVIEFTPRPFLSTVLNFFKKIL